LQSARKLAAPYPEAIRPITSGTIEHGRALSAAEHASRAAGVTPLPGKATVFWQACRKPLWIDGIVAVGVPAQFVRPIVMKSSHAT
jgi:hypothetical protein